jgi:hypothetical protein
MGHLVHQALIIIFQRETRKRVGQRQRVPRRAKEELFQMMKMMAMMMMSHVLVAMMMMRKMGKAIPKFC